MLRVLFFSVLAAVALAQDTPKPPEKVDRALRERINQFYDLHIKKEFRKAEGMVAKDTKEFFYSHNKPAYLGCETVKIEYSNNFKQAKATELCSQYIMVPGFEDKPMKVPFGSTWKVESGKWVWFVDQEAMKTTPWGKMVPGPDGKGPPISSAMTRSISQETGFVLGLVKLDKSTVAIRKGTSETITIRNTAPGVMDVSIMGTVPGVEAKIDHPNMKIGESATLTLQAGQDAKPGQINVKVEQTGVLIPLQITIP